MRSDKSDNVKTPVITDLTAKYKEDALTNLGPAQVKSFKADKGYGFFDTPNGDVFFHVSRYVELDTDVATLTQAWKTPRDAEGKVVVTPPKPGDRCLIRVSKDKNGRSVAEIWTNQKQARERAAALVTELDKAVAAVKTLPVLQLETIVVTRGEPRADNERRCFVSEVFEQRQTVFFGNNVSALLEAIGYNSRKATYLACYDVTDVKNRVRIPLPACKHMEYVPQEQE